MGSPVHPVVPVLVPAGRATRRPLSLSAQPPRTRQPGRPWRIRCDPVGERVAVTHAAAVVSVLRAGRRTHVRPFWKTGFQSPSSRPASARPAPPTSSPEPPGSAVPTFLHKSLRVVLRSLQPPAGPGHLLRQMHSLAVPRHVLRVQAAPLSPGQRQRLPFPLPGPEVYSPKSGQSRPAPPLGAARPLPALRQHPGSRHRTFWPRPLCARLCSPCASAPRPPPRSPLSLRPRDLPSWHIVHVFSFYVWHLWKVTLGLQRVCGSGSQDLALGPRVCEPLLDGGHVAEGESCSASAQPWKVGGRAVGFLKPPEAQRVALEGTCVQW